MVRVNNDLEVRLISESEFDRGRPTNFFRRSATDLQYFSFRATWSNLTRNKDKIEYYEVYAPDYYTAMELVAVEYANRHYISPSFVDVW